MEIDSLRAPACGCAVTCGSDGRQKRLVADQVSRNRRVPRNSFSLLHDYSGARAPSEHA